MVTEESFDGQYYVAHNKFYEQVRIRLKLLIVKMRPRLKVHAPPKQHEHRDLTTTAARKCIYRQMSVKMLLLPLLLI